MKNSLRTLGVAAALLCVASATAAAQNNSDAIAIGLSTAAANGAFSPGNAGNGTVTVVNASTVNTEVGRLSRSGGDNAAVGAAITGNPAALSASLTGAGIPSTQVNALMSALATLGSNPSPASLSSAIQAYNAMIAVIPNNLVANPAPSFMAVRNALIAIRAGR
jgi:hypothetical protein